MEPRDLIVTPIVIFLVYVGAYLVRNKVTDEVNRRYFFLALTLKIVGAIALGVVYQFYYSGGDTFAFHTHGSRHIWEAFMHSPDEGFRLLFSSGKYEPGLWSISDKIWYYDDQKSFFIIRIAALLDLFTFSSYSGTAVLFSVLSFIGGWMMFLTFYRRYPMLHRWLAISCLFVPSVIFWGSGILKDTITLAFLGMATYSADEILMQRRFRIFFILLLVFSVYVIASVKVYIAMSFIMAGLIWVSSTYFFHIRSSMLRVLLVPFIILACGGLSYYGINELVEDDPRYSFDKLAETVRVTAYDIRYWTGKNAGSGYSLGELDGSIGSVLRLAPSAINVSFFRPYPWEVSNPLMALSAVESFFSLMITIWVLYKVNNKIVKAAAAPEIIFCLVFAIVFAFGVGVSSYNFGTLARYKIPIFPYFFCGLGMLLYRSARIRHQEAVAFVGGESTQQ
jgi:hypothetical protein